MAHMMVVGYGVLVRDIGITQIPLSLNKPVYIASFHDPRNLLPFLLWMKETMYH